MNEKGGIGLGGLIIIAILIWFFFIRVDYKDVWWKGTATQRVIYCGSAIDPHCSEGETYYVPVTHIERSGSSHVFEINFNNGGHIETEGSCDKAANGMYDFDRFCRTTGYDEYGNSSMYIIAPL
jgi:hypothetical protein